MDYSKNLIHKKTSFIPFIYRLPFKNQKLIVVKLTKIRVKMIRSMKNVNTFEIMSVLR